MIHDDSELHGLNAHTPREGTAHWHQLSEHSQSVASLAERSASKFGAGAIGRSIGLLHDSAKADPRFQAYLRACSLGETGVKCPHSAPSAVAAKPYVGPFLFTILGHHAGLFDMDDAVKRLADADARAVASAQEWIQSLIPLPVIRRDLRPKLEAEMRLRMAFSCLVDADYLDTERHFNPRIAGQRRDYPLVQDYRRRLETHVSQLSGGVGRVNQARAQVLASCRKATEHPKGAFRLTVPTGGGKTLSSLSFALGHADHHSMDRVVVAIPYTSIIEQTAGVYAGAVGAENVLEHHSAVDIDETDSEQSERDMRRRLTSENWDCPLVVTTTVQLFESLLHNRPARCRKLHNIVNSVIVLDEIQALPPKTLGPVLDVLNDLVSNYGCSVVFCTATQLDYSNVDDRLLKEAVEIVPDYSSHFAALKRVEYVVEDKPWSLDRLVRSVANERQTLAVFNTRKDALRVALGVRDLADSADTVFHLSTLMCLHHRRKVLAAVRRQLGEKAPVRLISTQVIEAGVDVDFPVVYRDLGPLDRIVQVAGRCNREGKFDGLGRCVVVRLEESSAPQGPYKTAIDITGPILAEYGSRLDAPEAMATYSRDLFLFTETGSLRCPNDRATVQKLREEFNFATVARTFGLIEDDTTPVIVECYQGENIDIPALIAEWETCPNGWFRRVAPFAVNLFNRDLTRLQRDGLVHQHDSGAYIYSGRYDYTFGLGLDVSDPSDLIA